MRVAWQYQAESYGSPTTSDDTPILNLEPEMRYEPIELNVHT